MNKNIYEDFQIWISVPLSILREAEIHTISEAWNEWISILQNKCGKTQAIPKFCSSPQIFGQWVTMKSPMFGSVQIPKTIL